MTHIEASSLFVIMLALALVPSSSVALVVTRSAMLGIYNGVAVSLGIVLGDLVFISLAVFGLSAIAESMGWLFLSIKYLGATYLIWLGIELLKLAPKTTIEINPSSKKGNIVSSFIAGLFLTLGDIKAIFFYASLLPTFVNLESLAVVDIISIMLITIITVGGVKILYAFSAKKIVEISLGYQCESRLKKLAGCFMVGTGSYLIVKA